MTLSYQHVITRALAAGLVAGVLLAVYTVTITERTLDQAIALEEGRAAVHDESQPAAAEAPGPTFSRPAQVGGGAMATVVFAVAMSALFATVLARIRHRLVGWTEFGRVVWLAAVSFGAVALIPAVKYPANPPGVGDPATVQQRSLQYLVLVVLAIALAVGLTRLSGWLRSRLGGPTRVMSVVAATVIGYGLLLLVLPGSPDTIDPAVPAQLVWDFRLRSLGGLALLWAAIGIGLGWGLERAVATNTITTDPALARP